MTTKCPLRLAENFSLYIPLLTPESVRRMRSIVMSCLPLCLAGYPIKLGPWHCRSLTKSIRRDHKETARFPNHKICRSAKNTSPQQAFQSFVSNFHAPDIRSNHQSKTTPKSDPTPHDSKKPRPKSPNPPPPSPPATQPAPPTRDASPPGQLQAPPPTPPRTPQARSQCEWRDAALR